MPAAIEQDHEPADEIEDDLGAGGVSDKPPNWSVQIVKVERTIFEMYRRWDNNEGVLDLQPDFQRGFVWDVQKQSNLIESVLLRIPLPVVYVSEESEEETLVIDGQQRLTTLFRFMNNEFLLRNLRLLPELNGKAFRDLDGKLQRRFEDTPITAFSIQPGSDPRIKFEVFQRLNEGAVALTAQEIRNCLLRGPGLQLVQRLAAPGSAFRIAAGEKRNFARMRADELVLRCLAFLDQGPANYRGDMLEFLNVELRRLNTTTAEHRNRLASRFDDAVATVASVFGPNAFRRNTYSPALNAAIMDVLVAGFPHDIPSSRWVERKAAVRIAFLKLLATLQFADAISYSTGDTARVLRRFDLWNKVLHDVANNHA